MTLSKRLEIVSTLVDIGERVIDVGCDHAYLDIYLTQNNCNKCIAVDINKNALEIANKNINKYTLTDKIETRLTNGLTSIDIKDNDNIVIAGMGTYTILDILKTNRLSNTLIIASNNHIELLRREVINMGFYIDTEIFIIDSNKPYIIIKFIKGKRKYKKIDYVLGPILKNNIDYLTYLIKKEKYILNNISKKKILIRLSYNIIIFKLNLRLSKLKKR